LNTSSSSPRHGKYQCFTEARLNYLRAVGCDHVFADVEEEGARKSSDCSVLKKLRPLCDPSQCQWSIAISTVRKRDSARAR
jgi:hypothetical protein